MTRGQNNLDRNDSGPKRPVTVNLMCCSNCKLRHGMVLYKANCLQIMVHVKLAVYAEVVFLAKGVGKLGLKLKFVCLYDFVF